MTYEQKAKEITREVEHLLVHRKIAAALPEGLRVEVMRVSARALREAGNAKLEEAALAATAAGNLWAKADRDPTRAGCGTEIAALIRSLIQKD